MKVVGDDCKLTPYWWDHVPRPAMPEVEPPGTVIKLVLNLAPQWELWQDGADRRRTAPDRRTARLCRAVRSAAETRFNDIIGAS